MHPKALERVDTEVMGERQHLGGPVSPEAHDGWHHFARLHGVSVVALLEQLGLWLAELDDGDLPPPWQDSIVAGRALDGDRRSRSRRDR